jgi:enoyl-CoA hydratase/carnithine racemase
MMTIEGHIARVILQRPPVNALDQSLVSDLTRIARRLVRSRNIWLVHLGSSQSVFCAGADLHERRLLPDNRVLPTIRHIQEMMLAWSAVPQPIVVALNGAALGGGLELALTGDILIASDTAFFGFPETQLGIFPAAGGIHQMLRRTSPGVTKRWIFGGQRHSASEALHDGVIDLLAPADQFSAVCEQALQQLSAAAPLALRCAKKAISIRMRREGSAGMKTDLRCYAPLVASADRREALAAFEDKRKPEWKGT